MFSLMNLFRSLAGSGYLPPDRAATALAEKDAALAALFDTGTAGIVEIDLAASRFLRVNGRFCEFAGRTAVELAKLAPADLVDASGRDIVLQQWMKAFGACGRWEGELRLVRRDGDEFWVRAGVSVSKRDRVGRPLRCIGVLQDVTESVGVKDRLRKSEELLRLGQRVGRIGTFERDLRSGKLYCSAETRLIFGIVGGSRIVDGGEWLASFVPEDRVRLSETIASALGRRNEEIAVECRILRYNDGALRHIEMRARYDYDEAGRPVRSVGVVIDVTERKATEDRLAYAARHDPLTGLGNRKLFGEALERATAGDCAVLCLDLDRFKEVNDTFGHPAGDQLLIEVAERLRGELDRGDALARLGGDEFAIIRSAASDPEDLSRFAGRLVARIAEPFAIAGQRVSVGVSVGVAVGPRDGATGDDLLIAADLALYQAKRDTTRGWRLFAPEMKMARARRARVAALETRSAA